MSNTVKETVDNLIKNSVKDGRLPCALALKIANEANVAPVKVGEAANRLKIKIVACQLGCFK